MAMSFALCGAYCEGEFPQGATPQRGGTQGNQSVTITIQPGVTGLGASAFGQNPLDTSAGTIVTWINNDTIPHRLVSTTNAWDSGDLSPGESFSFTFNDVGTFTYFCGIHGAVSESGTINVTAGTGPTLPFPTASPSPSPFGVPAGSPSPTPFGFPTPL